MENQLVSVIIPVYNVEKYLEECIDSVLNQTYKNIEIIIVDDGSTDSSGNICDRYAETNSQIQVVHQQNSGLSATRNTGEKQAKGKYIYFLDSDDYIVFDAIEKLCCIAENNNADVVFFDAENFADNADMNVKQSYLRKNKYCVQSGIATLEQLQKNMEYHSAVPLLFLNREFLINNKISFLQNVVYEDMLYTYQVFCRADKVAQCAEALYHRRYRENSIMTSKKSKKYFDSCVTVYKYVRDFSVDNDISDTYVAKKYIARLAFNIFNNYHKLNKEDKKICRKDFKAAKKDILENNAYGDKSLKMKCYGNIFWFIYKVYEKTLGRF